jgi:subtilisin family serine protease
MVIRRSGAREGDDRLAAEVERVREAAKRRSREPFDLRVAGPADDVHYLYKSGDVLVSDRDLPRVESAFRSWRVRYRVADSLIGGVTLLRVRTDVDELLDRCDTAMGVGVVTPNHVLDVQPIRNLCPATEPTPATYSDRWPVEPDVQRGAGVRVAVVDTGFMPGFEHDDKLPWLSKVDRYDVDDDAYIGKRGKHIAPYGGHGTFSAGVVLSVAPGVTASVDDVLVGGVVDEATIVRQLTEALADSPDVISLSAGTYTRKNVPPKAFSAFWDSRFSHHKGVALVAAAGNNGDRQPFWPAAFPWALSVGALTRDGEARTEWSNHGGWVDLYAQGEDLVNAFPTGTYKDLDGQTHEFSEPMARWSGTSFSTPLVAGLVARRIAETGENGWRAARALRLVARENFKPGVGPRLLV